MGARTVGEVAGGTVLDRRGEHVAAGNEQGPLSLGRKLEVLDEPAHGVARGPRGHTVVGHGDRDRPLGANLGVVDPQLAVLLVNELVVVVGTRPAHVPGGAVRELDDRLGGQVPAIEVQRTVAVRHEVDAVRKPHGVALGAHRVRDRLDLVRGQVVDKEVLGPSARIALPGSKVPEQRRVHHPLAVGREIAAPRGRHRQRGRWTAPRRHGVQLALVDDSVGVAHRPEHHALAVRGPAGDQVVVAVARRHRPVRRVERELARHTTRGRHHVDLLVAVVLTGKGDHRAIGREAGHEFEPWVRGEPGRRTAYGRRRPEVPRVGEDHAGAMDVGKTQHLGLGSRRKRQQRHQDSQEPGKLQSSGHRSSMRQVRNSGVEVSQRPADSLPHLFIFVERLNSTPSGHEATALDGPLRSLRVRTAAVPPRWGEASIRPSWS